MTNVKQIRIGDTTFPIEDTQARTDIATKTTVLYSNTEPAEAVEGDLWASDDATTDLMDILNALFPIGSYSFGQHPNIGTWTEVEGDRALWLKNTVADGTEIAQALPNITGTLSLYWQDFQGSGAFSPVGGSVATRGAATRVDAQYYFDFNAHNSNAIYQDGANVQPNAYVMKVYKRTA